MNNITVIWLCTVGAHISGRLSVLNNNLAKYRETCYIFPNLHHIIDMIPSFNMLHGGCYGIWDLGFEGLKFLGFGI